MAAAPAAFETWGLTTPRERSEKLLALAAAVEGDLDELKRLEMANVGKPVSIIDFEFDLMVDNLRFFAGAARTLQAQAAGEYLEDHTSMLRRDPLGVAVGIAPWNYPLNMAVWKMGPALAAGNTFILKPSELTPLTALRVAELAADIFPPGVFNVVTGQGETLGDALVAPPRRGHRLASPATWTPASSSPATRPTPSSGSTSSSAARPRWWCSTTPTSTWWSSTLADMAYYNSGQDCTAPCRVIAGPGIYDGLVSGLGDRPWARWSPATRPIPTPRSGPVISADQQAAGGRHGVAGRRGRRRGGDRRLRARPAPASSTSPPWWPARPRTARSCSARCSARWSACSASATRTRPWPGPTAWTTACRPACGPATWAGPCACRAELQFGSVWVNDHIPIVSEMPHGGFKQSGYGKDMSVHAIEPYTELKHVMVKF